jgi:hypothetical protein
MQKYNHMLTNVQHYNHIANQNKADNEDAYKAWVESHSPDQIRVANLARQQLKRRATSRGIKRPGIPMIKDSRLVKKPRYARQFFVTERFASGDMKGIKVTDGMKTLMNEFASLSLAEKKVSLCPSTHYLISFWKYANAC